VVQLSGENIYNMAWILIGCMTNNDSLINMFV